MAHHTFYRLMLAVIMVTGAYSHPKCNEIDRKKCWCFNAESIDIQCPIMEPQISLTVTKINHKISLQCLGNSSPYIDLEIIPEMDVSESKIFQMSYCYFNNSFMDVLDKFNIKELKTLAFESMALKDNDSNISVSKESFERLGSLESLTMTYSTLSFAEDFLANTPNLLSLTLSRNHILELDFSLKNLSKLKLLDLSGNQINNLPDGIFDDLSNLTVLYFYNNNLTELSRNSLSGLNNLRLLEVSQNKLKDIAEDTFADLHNLVNISLRDNNIRGVPGSLFVQNPLLENIRMDYNKDMILSDYIFSNLTMLRSVALNVNKLKEVPENAFKSCVRLQQINLKNNELATLPEYVFKDLKSLKNLDLSYNKLNSLPNGIFSTLHNLEEINLGKNLLKAVNENLFKYMNNLKKLDLSKNRISLIDLKAFSSLQNSLTSIDLSFNVWNNNYSVPPEYGSLSGTLSPLNDLITLKELNLGHNNLTDIPELYALTNLRKMDLSYNEITNLEVPQFALAISYNYFVDLSHNKIEKLGFRYAEDIATSNSGDAIHYNGERSTVLKIHSNPIVCDCSNYDLTRYNDNQMKNLKTLVEIDQNELYCANDKHRKVIDVHPNHIDCPVLNGCPEVCRCSYKPYYTAIIVDCSKSKLTTYPKFNFTLDQTFNQTYLLLGDNLLTRGPTENETNYSNITNLDLSGNLISAMDWVPSQIKELNLNNNLLTNLDSSFIRKLNSTRIERLHLQGNPWNCDCKTWDLQVYLMDNYKKADDIFCMNSNTELTKLTELCKVSPYLTIMLPIILGIFLCFAIAFAVFYRYQTEIKIYLYAKNLCLWFVTEEELDKDKTYDVFISYANQDEAFIAGHLLPELEHGPHPFKVCVHTRDFIPGEFITEQVVNSVKDSKRTLVVLSNHYVNSNWGKLEFRTAHAEALSEGRTRVIVVIYGDLDETKLDNEFESYIKTNTYVKWGDKYFWNKLRYALPHSKNGFYEKNKKHAKMMLKIDDKFNLIKDPPSPSNTSTPPITLDPSLLESKQIIIDVPAKKIVEGESPLLIKKVY
ncbi:unnamed protein product [Ceutorhynchus assimilis]|uniref:TIR domain-containing protein n=1 Tax=Ceutorhynchus assimilis TaxID=467358 RepID=A0A9N9QCG0_9CUCU|nr:unnamed protein product [Ceutorhynchus assimilis]